MGFFITNIIFLAKRLILTQFGILLDHEFAINYLHLLAVTNDHWVMTIDVPTHRHAAIKENEKKVGRRKVYFFIKHWHDFKHLFDINFEPSVAHWLTLSTFYHTSVKGTCSDFSECKYLFKLCVITQETFVSNFR